MKFKEVISDTQVKDRLKDLVQKNRLSHALLFLGREGSGALPLAIAFAQYILCEKVHPQSKNKSTSLFGEGVETDETTWEDSCGQCSSCLKINRLIHPDL